MIEHHDYPDKVPRRALPRIIKKKNSGRRQPNAGGFSRVFTRLFSLPLTIVFKPAKMPTIVSMNARFDVLQGMF